jgi:hypothetical protein
MQLWQVYEFPKGLKKRITQRARNSAIPGGRQGWWFGAPYLLREGEFFAHFTGSLPLTDAAKWTSLVALDKRNVDSRAAFFIMLDQHWRQTIGTF